MKKLLLFICVSAMSAAYLKAQDAVSIKLEYKPATDSFYVSMIPNFNRAVFNLGPSQVTIVFTNNFEISSPAASTIAATGLNGAGWVAQDFALEVAAPNKKYVGFQTTGQNIGAVNNGEPKLLFRFKMMGAGGNCVGGAGLMRNYVNGFDLTDPTGVAGGDFSSVVNEGGIFDYFTTNSNVSLQSCMQLMLPVSILDFNARRENSNGIVTWTVTGEETNSDHYELERSTDGTNFQFVARVECRRLPGVQRYQYNDLNIAALNSKFVYYRLKQYDRDGRFITTSIRQLRFDVSEKGISMYPNPVRQGFYVNVPFTNPGQTKVSLMILSSGGQVVQAREITAQQASNYYFDIRNANLAAGDYYLRIVYESQVLDVKKFLVSKE